MLYNAGMAKTPKTAEQMQRHFKGMANHHRIEILLLVDRRAGITVFEIAEILGANFKTISQHTRYLVQAGLMQKRYEGRKVAHILSPYGRLFVRFIKQFRQI